MLSTLLIICLLISEWDAMEMRCFLYFKTGLCYWTYHVAQAKMLSISTYFLTAVTEFDPGQYRSF